MIVDVIDMKKDIIIEEFGNGLGFDKIIFGLKSFKILNGGDELKVRNAIESGKYDLLLNPHLVSSRDHLHFRRGGLNQVICKLLAQKKIKVSFSLDAMKDPVALGRIEHDIKLCKKFKVDVVVFSLAKNKYEMRGYKDLVSFCKIIGMTGSMAKKAFDWI